MLKNVIVCFVKDSISNSYKFSIFGLKPTGRSFKTNAPFL